tara:strand:- start:15 stop:257 length:243 start_codon:yes stop_codon:yes gene_type:complete
MVTNHFDAEPEIYRILNDPACPKWVREVAMLGTDQDHVKAANAFDMLAVAFSLRSRRKQEELNIFIWEELPPFHGEAWAE